MKMSAGRALVKVLESWNIKHIYGIPGSSVNGLMGALNDEKDNISYIQVRHESAGSMAATAHAKFFGEIGACFGSAAPGGSNLINGLYDAKMDRVPLLAIVGQTATENMNTNFFQEMDEIPLYSDVSVYNRNVTTSEQIPDVIEEAIRTAYSKKGVAVVIIPNDLAEEEIEFEPRKELKNPPKVQRSEVDIEDVNKVADMIKNAKNPVIYAGLGLKNYHETVEQVSEKFNIPIVTSASSIGWSSSNNHKNFMGSFGRLGTKPAFDIIDQADLVLFVGSNFPFARYWPKTIKVIQVNNEFADIGKQIKVDLGIVADGKEFLEALLKTDVSREESKILKAARINKKNWDDWLESVALKEVDGVTPEAVIKAVKENSTDDALYGLDVGNNTMHSVRMLPLNKNRRHIMSGWFATLGVGLPFGISAKLACPDRQVWTISGDGGFAMNVQEIITQARYELPIINIILNDGSYGFIQHAQINSKFVYGVDLTIIDWATVAKGMGAISFSVDNLNKLAEVMKEINELQKTDNKKPIVVDVKIPYKDPIDTSDIRLDTEKFSNKEIEDYKNRYSIFGQPTLSEILKTI